MTAIYLGVQTRSHNRVCVTITVRCSRSSARDCAALTKYNYKCFGHRVTRVVQIVTRRAGAIALKIESGNRKMTTVLLAERTERLRITATVDIYVYFYGSDRRPLLICIGGCLYGPESGDKYCREWCPVAEAKQSSCVCGCPGSGTRVGCTEHDALLKELTKVVGFLNTVNLYQHPGTSTSTGKACPTGTGGTTGAVQQCQPGSDATTSTTTCKYEVHKFQGQSINVKVECCPVKGSNCYRKLTHTAIGMNGSSGKTVNNGFRLGDVAYCSNTGSSRKGKIDYYGNGSNGPTSTQNGTLTATNKWAPLVAVHAYYYDADTDYKDPLLVVLEFKPNGVDSSNNDHKECYKLTKTNGGSLEWQKDDAAKCLVDKEGPGLVAHLDQIRYCLKYTIRIRLECKTGYELKGRKGSESSGTFDQDINGTTQEVKVEVCQVLPCPALTTSNYKCYRHKLTDALKSTHYQVAGLAFTLPCTGGGECCVNGGTSGVANGFVEIPVCVPVGQGDGKCPPVTGAQAGCQAEQGQGAATCPAVTPGPATCPPKPGTSVPCSPGQTATEIPRILYNKCMGDVCVYFYAKGGGDGSEVCKNGGKDDTDSVPLMVRFNGQFYAPCDRDSYFTRWVCVENLKGVTGKSGCKCCCGANADGGTDCTAQCSKDCGTDCTCCSKLVTELDTVNEALNRIDLDKSNLANGSNGKGYGLPEKDDCQGATIIRGCKLDEKVGNYRICLTKQQPSGDGTNAYTRVVHRTKNGFHIGDITYCGHDFATHGVTLDVKQGGECNGVGSSVGAACSPCSGPSPPTSSDCTIKVANGTTGHNNHKTHVSSCQCNTVVVYYSKTDTHKQLPQLIVVLKTDKPVENGKPVTVSGDRYGYYVLATQNGVSNGYQYEWRMVDVNGSKSPPNPVTLDEKTDFSLLNSGVILLERTGTGGNGSCNYGDSQISAAVTSAIEQKSLVKSPGNGDDINRLKNRDITVKDETTSTHTCLNNTGFKLMTHCLDNLVNLGSAFQGKINGVKLITGLKLLTPTRASCQYKQVTLNGSTAGGVRNGATDSSIKYHQPTNGNKICVYFYGCDPRPLLVCYNGWAYRANSKDDYDAQKWHKDTTAGECKCTDPQPEKCDQCPLLKALVAVSDLLNPVRLHRVPKSPQTCRCYYVHWFNGKPIWIKVEFKPPESNFCYNRYTHTHFGIGCGGTGFRLGNVHYKQNCIKENGSSPNNGANGKCINSVIEKNDQSSGTKPCETATSIVVFYYKLDKEHANPIVVAMCTGDCDKLKCNLYYVLKSRAEKKYQKKSDTLDMNDDNELTTQLDSALFGVNKHLRVVLSQRPQPAKYSPGDVKNNGQNSELEKQLKKRREDKEKDLTQMAKKVVEDAAQTAKATGTTLKPLDPEAIKSSLMHHVLRETSYKAQLCDNGPPATPPSSPSTETTTITVTEVDCSTIYSQGGYRCFKHDLVNANEIEQVGGLKLCLWVNGQGTQEIKLCTGQDTGGKNGKTGQQVELSYTTCKGDLYVFFYKGIFQKLDLKKVWQNNLVSHIFISKTFFKKDFKQHKSDIISAK